MSYHDSALLQKISVEICQSIIAIQQQQPELLIAKYRTINRQISTNKSALSAKFRAILSQTQSWDELLQKLQSSLKAVLVPAAFDSQIISDLISVIEQLNSENIDVNTNHLPQRQSVNITILLLDAENLQLNTNTEKFLTTICNSPVQVKIAFANWSNRGKLDVELHERGYDLIHVPAGRDNADGKMIALGSSIHERYPNVKEVFVCSSDKVMTNLCNTLQQNGILVYQARKNMGETLANKIIKDYSHILPNIDVVMPIPDSARISALRASYVLQKPYCEGLIKNNYIGRTFIMPNQEQRNKNLKIKLNTIDQEFKEKNVLIIDDSIVRGNTSIQIIKLIRKAGAKSVFFASIAPPVIGPNFYGIAIPTSEELVAYNKTNDEICNILGADCLIYNDLNDVIEACRKLNENISTFETSCFEIEKSSLTERVCFDFENYCF